jgi:hypothetical protein
MEEVNLVGRSYTGIFYDMTFGARSFFALGGALGIRGTL